LFLHLGHVRMPISAFPKKFWNLKYPNRNLYVSCDGVRLLRTETRLRLGPASAGHHNPASSGLVIKHGNRVLLVN